MMKYNSFQKQEKYITEGEITMITQITIEKGQKPTKEQLDAIKEIRDEDIVFDRDCPEMTPAMRKSYRCAIAQRNRTKIKDDEK